MKYTAEHPGAELTACCDIDPARAEGFAAKFGFLRSYTDWRVMLAAEKPDAVCLLVNYEYIYSFSMEILQMGIPLLLEKPPGMNEAETLRMAETAARGNVPHAVAFNRRTAPVIGQVREKTAALPAAQRFMYEMLRANRRERDFSPTAIHGIDALRYVSGADYRSISFAYQELPQYGEGVCNIYMECRMTGGAAAGLLFAPVSGVDRECGRVITGGESIEYSIPLSNADFIEQGFYEENRAFFEAVRAGRKPEHSIETALQSVAVADCIRNRRARYP
jgi:predicted dehydrogenase